MGKTLETVVYVLSVLLLILTFPFSIWLCFRAVNEYQRAIIFRLGRIKDGGPKGPGLFFIIPCIDEYEVIDLRVYTYTVPPQEILTKDSVTVYVDAVVYFKVIDPLAAILKIKAFSQGTNILSATTLRNELGTKKLHEVLSEREAISRSMQEILDEATNFWGVKVDRVEIKDVSLPLTMQRAMAAEGEATREAKAKVIAAEGEFNAAMSLKEASDIIAENPTALQLRYLQTLTTIALEENQTIIFPLPTDILRSFMPK